MTPWTVACHALLSMGILQEKILLQEIFLTQGSNLGLLHCRRILYHLSHQGSLQIALGCSFLWLSNTPSCVCVYISICMCVCVCVCVYTLSHVRLSAAPWTVACQVPLSKGFSSQQCWSGLLCPPVGDLPDPGIKPMSLASSALGGGFFYH